MLHADVRLINHDPIPQHTLHTQGKASAARDDYTSSSPSFRQENTSQRALQLQPFIQQQCSAAVQSMGQELDAQLKHLGQPGMDLDGAKLVEQALLLGLCQASAEAMPCHEHRFVLFRVQTFGHACFMLYSKLRNSQSSVRRFYFREIPQLFRVDKCIPGEHGALTIGAHGYSRMMAG